MLKVLFLAYFCTGLSDLSSVIYDFFDMMDIIPPYVYTFMKTLAYDYIIICLFCLTFSNLLYEKLIVSEVELLMFICLSLF